MYVSCTLEFVMLLLVIYYNQTLTLPSSGNKQQQNSVDNERQSSASLTKVLSRRHRSLHNLTTIVDNSSQGENHSETASVHSACVVTLPQLSKGQRQSDSDAQPPSYTNWLQIVKSSGRSASGHKAGHTVDQAS